MKSLENFDEMRQQINHATTFLQPVKVDDERFLFAHTQAMQAMTGLDIQLDDSGETIGSAIFEAAENSGKQVKLLERQLQELQAQNEMYKAELESNRAEIETNKKIAKKARHLNIAAFVLSIVLPLVSIGASVLIAIFCK